jgi:beta-glucosidase
MSFPEHFTWGAAASSYQIEGGWDADGKGPSVWDMFTRTGNRVWERHTGRQACDHYHRYREDVALMREMGLRAYRLSVSWPRVIPDGAGRPNAAGLDFYDRLVDELLAAGIEPWITLFHFDYPYALFLRGGWLNPESPRWFAKYTETVVKRLSDRVTRWMTVNEPQCFIDLGHGKADHAPGLSLDVAEVLLAGHHALLAHGRAVEQIREHARRAPFVGWSPAGSIYLPATDTPQDLAAARQATADIYPDGVWNNRWWGDPVIHGRYPEEGFKVYGAENVPKHSEADMRLIRQPLDFYGCNIFSATPVQAGPDGRPVKADLAPGYADTHHLWKVTPEALYWGPRFLSEMYGLPIVVTENGLSSTDSVSLDGQVHDPGRVDFMHRYLLALRRALAEGIDVRGYFAWSVMDNFEWSQGYQHRFGLIHVDYETQRRTLKDSAHWYREVIATNGASLGTGEEAGEPLHYAVKEAIQYVRTHIQENFKIKDLAAHLRCHPDFLSRKFKATTGSDLSDYIRQARIDHARDLLKNPKTLIDDAAELSGFSDRIHFSKVFRKLTGQTPAEYQRQFRVPREEAPAVGTSLRVTHPRSSGRR